MTLQLIFRAMNIDISGGSISRRQYLSTSEFQLSKYLLILNVDVNSIYQSKIIHKNVGKLLDKYSYATLPIYFFKLLIELRKNKIISALHESISKLEKEISDMKKSIKSLEYQTIIKQNKKSKNNLSSCRSPSLPPLKGGPALPTPSKLLSQSDSGHSTLTAGGEGRKVDGESKPKNNLDTSVELFQQKILKKENEILSLQSKITKLNNAILNLFKSSHDEIKSVYFNYFHNQGMRVNSKQNIKQFNKQILILSSNLNPSSNSKHKFLDKSPDPFEKGRV
jgi:hypothetical protein